ncbi:MAG: phosphate-selective porin OprO and OprP [Thermoanaerobaculia bacterium]|nr:phosphate-selective porin OprO and OprP [Thermoanaerobaculia bacterium]
MRTVAMTLTLFVAVSAMADDSAIEARLIKLEQEVAALRQENEQLRRDLGVEVVARAGDVKMAGKSEALQLGGMVQVQSEAGDQGDSRFSDGNDRFYLRRARLNAAGRFLEEFNFRAEIELAGSLSNTSGLRAQLTDTYINWNRFDSANIRIGQFKTPFGFEQLYADPQLTFAERPLVSDRLTPGRQLGAQGGGDLWFDRFNWAAGVFNGNGINQNFNDNDRFLAVGRVSVAPISGRYFDQPSRWTIGIDSFRSHDANISIASEFGIDSTPTSAAKDNIFAGVRRGIGYDSQLQFGPVEAWGEYLQVTFDPADRVPLHRFRSNGWSGQLSAFVIDNKLQLAARRERFDPNADVGRNETSITTLGASWYFKQNDIRLQLDWLRSNVPGVTKTQQKWMARLQTVF